MPAGFSGLPHELDHSPRSTEFGHWNSSHQCGVRGPNRLKGRAIQTGAERGEGAGTEQTGIASLLLVKLSPMSAPGPTGDRQEHLPSSPSQELARGGACSGALTFSRASGPWETCRNSAATCSIQS